MKKDGAWFLLEIQEEVAIRRAGRPLNVTYCTASVNPFGGGCSVVSEPSVAGS